LEPAKIIVTDMLGQLILQIETNQKNENIKIENNGVYLLSILTKNATTLQKIIVSKE
jgi:hypothetical protein